MPTSEREEGLLVEVRTRFRELQELNENQRRTDYITQVNKLKVELSRVSERLLSKYAVSTPQGIAVAPIANLYLKAKTGLVLPNVGQGPMIRVPRQLIGLSDRSGFRGLFRSIVNDLISIERLGKVHSVITSRICRDPHAEKFAVKGETSDWLGKDSWWKKWF